MTGHEINTEDGLQRAVGRIEGKMDQFFTMYEALNSRLNDHSDRLDVLEKGRARRLGWMAGFAAAISAAFTLTSTYIAKGH